MAQLIMMRLIRHRPPTLYKSGLEGTSKAEIAQEEEPGAQPEYGVGKAQLFAHLGAGES